MEGIQEERVGKNFVGARMKTTIRLSREIAVVVVDVILRISQCAAAIVVFTIHAIEGEDVVLNKILVAFLSKVENSPIVFGEDVMDDSVVASGQKDSAGAIEQADISFDDVVRRAGIAVYAIACVVKNDVAS